MQQKSKRQKHNKLDRLLMNAMPKSEKPSSFFTIESPEPYHFPLQQTFLEGIQLVEQYVPSEVNKLIASPFSAQRIFKFKGKLIVQGRDGIYIGNHFIRMPEVTAISCGSNYFAAAFQNRTLALYTNTFQLIKLMKHFSNRKISVLKIIDTPPEFEGIIMLSSTGSQLYVHRLEKSFFNAMACKLTHQVIKSKEPIVQIIQLPRRLKHYIKEDAAYNHVSVFAILSGTQIWLLKIDHTRLTHQNFSEIVYAKQYRNKQRLSSASWGERVATNGIPHLVLTYTFGHCLYLAILNNISKYLEVEAKVKYQWSQSQPLSMMIAGDNQKQPIYKQIIFSQHIKRSQILLILEDGQLNIFHTSNIDLFEKSFQSSDLQIITYNFGDKINPLFLRSDERGDLVTYVDSFALEYTGNEVMYLSDQQLKVYVYCNWKQICDLLKRQEENYSSAMNFLIALYRRANRFDLGVTSNNKFQDELSEYIQSLTLEYLRVKLPKFSVLTQQEIMDQLSKQYSEAIDLFLVPVELLVNTYEFVFLFQIVRDKIVDMFSEKIFYKILEPFIQHARIKYIPQNQLKQTLDYYVFNQQLDLVERLAIYFDLQQIEKGIIIQCCINNNLAVSLAFICTQGNEGEFVTPFVKFWGIGEDYRKQGIIEYAQLFAIRALWYVRLCLQRNMALKEFTYEKYGYLISILTEHFFTKSMIVGLLDIRVEACLETLSYYFTIENASIVNTYCKLKIKESEIKQLEYIRPKPDNVKLELMLSAIYSFLEDVKLRRSSNAEREEDNHLFIMLLSRIIIYKSIKFTKDKYIRILKQLIHDYKMLNRINYGLEGDQISQIHEESCQFLASEYINKLLTLIINQQTQLNDPIKKEEMNEIYYVSRQADLIELQAHINFLSGHYGACIDVYLRATVDQRQRVFRFLESAFRNLDIQRKKKQRKILEKEVKEKITHLISLNAEKSIRIIQAYLPESQEELIIALEGDGGLQLEYLQELINKSTKISDKSMVKYISRMCELKPNQCLEALRKHPNFPVEDTLKICEKYQIFDCMEYLYERLGNIEKSMQIATMRIDQILSERISFEELQMEPYVKVAQILNNAVEVCIKNHSESVWQALFDAAVALFKKYKKNPNYAGDISLFYEMNAKIMYEMMRHCNIEHSMWLIQHKYKSLDMGGSMKGAFIQTLSNFSYTENILFSANSLTRSTLAQYETDYMIRNMSAYSVSAFCLSCGQKLDKTDKCIGFYCGHNYHKECVPEGISYCIGCLSEEQNQFYIYLNNFNQANKFKLDKLMEQSEQLRKTNLDNFKQAADIYEQKQFEEKKGSETQTRMTKMLDFDKVVKIEQQSTEQIEFGLQNGNRKRKVKKQLPPPTKPVALK